MRYIRWGEKHTGEGDMSVALRVGPPERAHARYDARVFLYSRDWLPPEKLRNLQKTLGKNLIFMRSSTQDLKARMRAFYGRVDARFREFQAWNKDCTASEPVLLANLRANLAQHDRQNYLLVVVQSGEDIVASAEVDFHHYYNGRICVNIGFLLSSQQGAGLQAVLTTERVARALGIAHVTMTSLSTKYARTEAECRAEPRLLNETYKRWGFRPIDEHSGDDPDGRVGTVDMVKEVAVQLPLGCDWRRWAQNFSSTRMA